MAQQTAVEWLEKQLLSHTKIENSKYIQQNVLDIALWQFNKYLEQAKQMESEIRKEDFKIGYNQGYLDAQLNHVNDADNLAEERDYLQSQIDDIDKKIKEKQDKIASLLINGELDLGIKGWTIGPFGTPEKL